MKKIITVCTLLTMSIMILAGCSCSTKNNTAKTNTENATGNLNIQATGNLNTTNNSKDKATIKATFVKSDGNNGSVSYDESTQKISISTQETSIKSDKLGLDGLFFETYEYFLPDGTKIDITDDSLTHTIGTANGKTYEITGMQLSSLEPGSWVDDKTYKAEGKISYKEIQ